MSTKLLFSVALAAAVAGAAFPAFAHHAVDQSVVQVLGLKDGSTLYVFKDGKMAKADRYNRPTYLKEGEILEVRDGRKVVAVGNEVARLATVFRQEHGK